MVGAKNLCISIILICAEYKMLSFSRKPLASVLTVAFGTPGNLTVGSFTLLLLSYTSQSGVDRIKSARSTKGRSHFSFDNFDSMFLFV